MNNMSILVVDANPKNVDAIMFELDARSITRANSYKSAMDVLSVEEFDVALINLKLPASREEIVGERAPLGMFIMLEALSKGVRHVAVFADPSDSNDPLYPAFVHASEFALMTGGSWQRLICVTLKADGTKDWATALDRLIKD